MFEAHNTFLADLAAFIRQRRLLQSGQSVLVAVSGGPDSMALAAALLELGGYDVHLAHVNHCIRPDAEADAQFVRESAQAWGVDCHVETVDVPALARRTGLGIEEACRVGRYDALISMARRLRISAVAVAHHRDDQVETVLHRLFRGTHLRGLTGMQERRRLAEGLWLIRPLLWASRSQIEEFCRQRKLAWRTDSTNQEVDYTRNFIRLTLLPLLRERINPKVDEAVWRLSAACVQAKSTLETLAAEVLERSIRKSMPGQMVLRLAPLRKAEPFLASLALRLAVERLGVPQKEFSQERFGDLLAVISGEMSAADLPGGLRASSDGKNLTLVFAPIQGQANGPYESQRRMESGTDGAGED